jgi:hypothetical protein
MKQFYKYLNKLKYTWTTPWEEIGTAPGGRCSVPMFGK